MVGYSSAGGCGFLRDTIAVMCFRGYMVQCWEGAFSIRSRYAMHVFGPCVKVVSPLLCASGKGKVILALDWVVSNVGDCPGVYTRVVGFSMFLRGRGR